MALDENTVRHIAHLTKLDVKGADLAATAEELGNILNLVEQMNAVNTDGIEVMTHPIDATLRLREDEVTAHNNRNKLLSLCADSEQGLFLVPKVMD